MTEENLIVFENSQFKIYLDIEQGVIQISGYGNLKMELAKEAWLKAIDFAAEHQILKWIGDHSHTETLHADLNTWWMQEWYPLAVKTLNYSGKRYVATVLSPRFYAEMATKISTESMLLQQKELVAHGADQMEHRYFKSISDAENWLKEF
jgi:hypothetical protein